MPELQKADPRARRTAFLIVLIGAVAGTVMFAMASAMGPAVEIWLAEDLPTRSRLLAGVLAVLTAVPAAGMSVYLWRLGGRTLQANRYPPPGLRVVRDTPVAVGETAARRGRALQIMAVALGASGVVLGLLLWHLLSMLPALV